MTLENALLWFLDDPANAQRFTHWLSTGDASGLPDELASRSRRFVNADPSNRVPTGEWEEEVGATVFTRPDGTRWEHRVVRVGSAYFYAQRLDRADGPRSGSLAVADPGVDRIDIWLDAPKAPRSPADFARAYVEMLGE